MPLTTAELLRHRRHDIILAWERAVRARAGNVTLESTGLGDHLPQLIDDLARWIEQEDPRASQPCASAIHVGVERLRGAYDLPRLMDEFRVLRETIVHVVLDAAADEEPTRRGALAARQAELARLSSGLHTAVMVAVEQLVAARERTVAGLAATQRRYTELFESSPDATFVSLGGRVVLVNPACARLFGARSPDALVGLSPQDLFAPAGRDAIVRCLADVERGQPPPLTEQRIVRRDGEGRDVEVATAAFADVEGVGVQVILRDITDRKRADEALRRSEARSRPLFESIDEGFCIIEVLFDGECAVDYRFLEVNPAFEEQTGIQRGEGRRMREIAPDHEQHWFDVYGRVARTGEPARFQLPAEALGRFYDVYAFRVGVPEQRRVAILFRDILAQHRAEQALRRSEERFRALVTASSDVVYRMSADWREMWQLDGRDFVADTDAPTGNWLEDYIHPDDRTRVEAEIGEAIRTKSVFELEHRVLRVDGTLGWTFSRAVPLLDQDGAIVEWFGAASDVTNRKLAEEGLREADRRKTEFLAVLSHELRNPLAPIRNSIQLLERAPQGSEQAARARQVLRRQTDHLTRLVDDLLDITRVSQGKITLQRTQLDLADVVRATADDLRSTFDAGGVELTFERPAGPVWIDGDPTRVAQVVSNLLQNAVKFTPSRGAVAVRVTTAAGRATLSVKDTGAGMDPAQIDRMFEPFVQGAQGLARASGGLGLGLALVKGLVNQHGGSVSARSDGPGLGSEFVVALPLVARAGAPSDPAAAHAGGGLLVLVVEDNADAGQTLADVLELSGHRVRVALDGRSGLALARELRPDVILCDIGLPDVDGYEFARAVRGEPALARTRLIALTGYAQPEDRERARDAGFDSHVAKPPPLEVLARLFAESRGRTA
jgi:PAS domain S-box-containing protein